MLMAERRAMSRFLSHDYSLPRIEPVREMHPPSLDGTHESHHCSRDRNCAMTNYIGDDMMLGDRSFTIIARIAHLIISSYINCFYDDNRIKLSNKLSYRNTE